MTAQAPPEAKTGGSDGDVLDLVGVGFGPSNLALAILCEEENTTRGLGDRITARYLERQPHFGWHDGMLLPGTDMQISFLKDLVTQRDPTSSYSFLNYLNDRGRLSAFINLQTFTPSRREFHDYLSWAACRVTAPVDYGTSVERIGWNGEHYEVATSSPRGRRTLRTRSVVLGTGIAPHLPDGVETSRRVFHNHQLIDHLQQIPSLDKQTFVVIGAGQSAAEVVKHLYDTYPEAQIHNSFRGFGYTPSDDTPFANQIFDPESVDDFYTAPAELKRELLVKHRLTNYSAVDEDLIDTLFQCCYDEQVAGIRRLHIHRVTCAEITGQTDDHVTVQISDLADRDTRSVTADAVIYATGFRPRDPGDLLDGTINVAGAFVDNLPVVDRDYRFHLPHETNRAGGIYLNGNVEHSHGLTSSLLSNVAVRARDILTSITESSATAKESTHV
ncbi:lysine N(6)-hydroxylase/L-ornithine N(5)-oxygenase family protein [uncultured Corynebacterium sp.]|uniref:lysine N(6)-hydroxylase/L-ornithine N(5)-oxygenase family protein n=1 Tax=uncultured Corynebacterium sp. TaxID=159447 RepID=UPI0025E87AB9|nr:SidA/IucD/PvdA family monooxygenase [uncultured Corynebacterium sp.]